MNYSNSSTRLRHPNPSSRANAEAGTVLSVETDKRGTHLRLRKITTVARGTLRRSAAVLGLLLAAAGAQGQNYTLDLNTPTMDKWVYPFASNGGGPRTTAPTFGAVGNIGTFDDRDGQFFVAFDTAGTVPSGLGDDSYLITSARLTLSLSFGVADSVVFDGTYDSFNTYNPADGTPINGDDAGRPMELYGAAFRNGLNILSVVENTAFTTSPSGTLEGVRTIFPSDFLGGVARDVSNNIRDAFDPIPFAIGQVAAGDLNGDGTMQGGIDVTFTFNLNNPDVIDFLQDALDLGRIGLVANSLHTASMGGPATRPEFDAKELGLAGIPGRLDLDVTVIPEPNAASLLIVGVAGLALWRNRRRVVQADDLP